MFLSPVDHRTDTSGKSSFRQGNRRDGQHQARRLILIPCTLRPKICIRKRMSPVGFDINRSGRKIESLSIDVEYALQPVRHADDAMGTLHIRNQTERPHDV